MDGNKIVWNVADNDLFTLYHGGAGTTGYENATYKATANEGAAASLTTPSVIKPGSAIMVWPVDTAFNITSGDNLSIKIPATLKNIENNIPYVSDLITIAPYGTGYNGTHGTPAEPNEYNTAGKDRKYPVVMRPMASQLIVKADYADTDETIAALYDGGADGLTGEDAIEPISLTSVDLQTKATGADKFTTKIALAFNGAVGANWASVAHNAWSDVTEFGAPIAQAAKLTTQVLTGNESCKFLILPQGPIASGVDDGAVIVNTIYGKVVVAAPGIAGSKYNATEIADAWYRFISAASKAAGAGVGYDASETVAATAGDDGKFKTTSAPANGMMQTINVFSNYTMQSATSPVKGEPVGAAATRYVKVLLTHLDMSGLHVKKDKQLRDAAKVWKKMGLDDVTVYLDGNSNNEFAISQKTIKVINDINASVSGKSFKVKPCVVGSHKNCNTIVITGGGELQDITFIEDNGGFAADVALKAGQSWSWKASGDLRAKATGVASIINRGTLESAGPAILQTAEPGTPFVQNNIPFVNDGTWNINSGVLRIQFDVTNNGVVNIKKGAQYRQDGTDGAPFAKTTFTNERYDVPSRFGGDDTAVGTIWNYGTFATVGGGEINNYGLIEHQDYDAKTYITTNQTAGADFTANFADPANKMGRINLPWNNMNEDNISINAALAQGFVSLTVDDDFKSATLDLGTSTIGNKVNYLKVNSSSVKQISTFNPQIKYLEIEAANEIAWNVTSGAFNFTGLMVLSDVNIKLGSNVSATVTYLGADMYVGGTFNKATTNWDGYFGDTSDNVATQYITFK
jgi:hypothetical protein